MRLIIPAIVTLALFISANFAVLAENSASSPASTKERSGTKRLEAFVAQGERPGPIRERIASKAATLKIVLQTFKDQSKAQKVERINTNLNMINQNQTSQMSKHLDKMSDILKRVEIKATASADASASAAISNAKTAIANSQAVVASQSAKDYSLTITSESTVRVQAKAMRDKLHTDLKATRATVIAAKKAVSDAIRAVALTLGGTL